MRIHILGIGPIGSLLSFHLRRELPPSIPIHLFHRTQRNALDITANGGFISVERAGVILSADGFKAEVLDTNKLVKQNPIESEPVESLFVTVKSHHTLSAIKAILPRISSNATIVLLQNGMGVYEQLVHDVFRNPELRPHFILASSTHGAWFKGFHNVVHSRMGTIKFGIVPDPAGRQFEANLSNQSLPPWDRKLRLDDIHDPSNNPDPRYRSLRNTVAALCSLNNPLSTSWIPMEEIQLIMRRKLVVSAVIDSITALMNCRNGDIFTTAASYRLMNRLCQEASDVFSRQLQSDTKAWLESLDDPSENATSIRVPYLLTAKALQDECIREAQLTKGNISPMLVDIRSGKSTEVDFVNGYLLNLGSTYKVPMPAMATMLNLVKMRCDIPLDQAL